jgi:two-component system, NtrC family, response regulator GlrR
MRVAKLLLLNSDASQEFIAALREILAALPHPALSLRPKVFEPGDAASPEGLSRTMSQLKPDLCFVTSRSPLGQRAGELLGQIKACAPEARVIVGLEEAEPEQMVELLRLGALDFVTPPLRAVDILPRIWRWTESAVPPQSRPRVRDQHQELKHLVGRSDVFLDVINKIPAVACCDAGVLIAGETGTGKELCARAIHYMSPRASGPFIPVNCGAIPLDLVENELFGHAPGAFTGAATMEFGLIHEADGGTLFLDEIDSLPLQAQVKLLRFLQDKVYKPLGAAKIRAANVRVVAAMNGDPPEAVSTGRLRRDLYYRLNVIPLKLPPLRERRGDILLLAHHFLSRFAAAFGKPARDFTPAAVQALNGYDWPGNVRELEHVIEQGVVFSDGPLLDAADIRLEDGAKQAYPESFKEAKANLIRQFEKSYLQDLLLANHGNVSRAARAAHKNRRALWHLIRKHEIDIRCFRTEAE